LVLPIPIYGDRSSPLRLAGFNPRAAAGQDVATMSAATVSEVRYADRTLADVAASLPGATRIFRRHKLDFCCGGGVSLADAAAAKGLNLAELESDLGSVAALALPPERPEGTQDLIRLLEDRYHAVHRRELPELVRLARRVEAVHRDHPAAPHGLADRLERMVGELEDHMQKEEQILFPLMRRGGHPMISQPIYVMTAEHDDHGGNLRELERLTNDFEPPDGACTTWRALYAGTQKFVENLTNHIHIENNVLFPRFNA
jgi:regulator of cell morphogenesis and NO signaling